MSFFGTQKVSEMNVLLHTPLSLLVTKEKKRWGRGYTCGEARAARTTRRASPSLLSEEAREEEEEEEEKKRRKTLCCPSSRFSSRRRYSRLSSTATDESGRRSMKF